MNFRDVLVRYEEELHVITARLHPENIMHNLHDDVIPLYHLLKEHLTGGSSALDMPFDLHKHRLLFMDGFGFSKTSR